MIKCWLASEQDNGLQALDILPAAVSVEAILPTSPTVGRLTGQAPRPCRW